LAQATIKGKLSPSQARGALCTYPLDSRNRTRSLRLRIHIFLLQTMAFHQGNRLLIAAAAISAYPATCLQIVSDLQPHLQTVFRDDKTNFNTEFNFSQHLQPVFVIPPTKAHPEIPMDVNPAMLHGDDWDRYYDAGGVLNETYSGGGMTACHPLGMSQAHMEKTKSLVARRLPLIARRKVVRTKPLHLFLIVPPYWGSTSLLSLVSSSPNVTTLCESGVWQCEGTWLLADKYHMLSSNPNADNFMWKRRSVDWGKALEIYEKYWDPAQPIRVEKSPPNIAKVAEIADHFRNRKDEVAFIFMTRGACFGTEYPKEWGGFAELLRHGLEEIHLLGGYRYTTLQYEDMLKDPYRVSSALLDFLPELEQLDPAGNNIHSSGDRATPVAEYIVKKGPFENKETEVSQEKANLNHKFGYP